MTGDRPPGKATMSLSINTNVQSLNTQRALTLHAATQEKLIARQSSGSRINSASDDPAGQAIAARMASTQRDRGRGLRRHRSRSDARANPAAGGIGDAGAGQYLAEGGVVAVALKSRRDATKVKLGPGLRRGDGFQGAGYDACCGHQTSHVVPAQAGTQVRRTMPAFPSLAPRIISTLNNPPVSYAIIDFLFSMLPPHAHTT